jgi:hypothetical protein
MAKQRKPGPWHETKREVCTDTRSGETIYEVREQRILPGGYVETKANVKRWERAIAPPTHATAEQPLRELSQA